MDLLWHSHKMIEHFQKKSASVAVPCGVSAIDENTAATKAHTLAKTYMPSKPDKYGIHFYAVVGYTRKYMSSIFNNKSGNTPGEPTPAAYCQVFWDLHTPYDRRYLINMSQFHLHYRIEQEEVKPWELDLWIS